MLFKGKLPGSEFPTRHAVTSIAANHVLNFSPFHRCLNTCRSQIQLIPKHSNTASINITFAERISPLQLSHKYHMMSDPSIIFCCPSALLTTVATYRSRKECLLWYFARSMSDRVSSPADTPLTTTSVSGSASPILAGLLAAIPNESPFVIQFEKWVGGQRDETLYPTSRDGICVYGDRTPGGEGKWLGVGIGTY